MVDIWIPYGKTEICARVPTRYYLGNIQPKEKQGIADPRTEIERAMHEPIGTPQLKDIVRQNDNIAIVIDDHTRATPSNFIVPPVLDELNKSGVKDENITIIAGCGTHRPPTSDEMKTLVGEEVLKRVSVITHDCKAKDMVYVGKTKTHGTKVYVNKTFAEANLRILIGDIELHYYAGYGGGRKSVLPGVSSERTIQRNHAMIRHPKAQPGVLEGNPINEDMVEAAKLAKADFIVNIVTNSKNEVVRAFAGDVEQAFSKGVQLVDDMYKVPIDKRADIVIVSSGGYPHDINLYQAHKGLNNALHAVKRGGVIIWTAECLEGHGNDVFYEWMTKIPDLKEMEKEIKRNFRLGGHKAYFLLKTLQKVHVILVSAMPDYYANGVFKVRTAGAINDAIRNAFTLTRKNGRVWVMPHGNITLPILRTAD